MQNVHEIKLKPIKKQPNLCLNEMLAGGTASRCKAVHDAASPQVALSAKQAGVLQNCLLRMCHDWLLGRFHGTKEMHFPSEKGNARCEKKYTLPCVKPIFLSKDIPVRCTKALKELGLPPMHMIGWNKSPIWSICIDNGNCAS